MEEEYRIIRDMYIDKQMTGKEIAKVLGYKSAQTIYNKMDKAGIKRRDISSCQRPYKLDKEELEGVYLKQQKSTAQIAFDYNVSEETVRRSLIRNGIKRRERTCRFGGWNKGKNLTEQQKRAISNTRKRRFENGTLEHWNKGNNTAYETRMKISKTLRKNKMKTFFSYGSDWNMQRTSCLQRDNYTCQQCGSKEKIEVHHWEPYRFCYDNSLENLVTLCFDCHKDKHREYIEEGFIKEAEEVLFYG